MGKVLGLDVGEKKIGVAIGDTESKFAFPRAALLVESWSEAWVPVLELLQQENVATVIVGLPLEQQGQVGMQAQRVQEFVAELQSRTDIQVVTRDERSTTQAVQREQTAAGRTLTRGQEDSLAAQLLVESYLQELSK